MQLVVIGMHRTGTSALTGVLSLCGAYVGTGDSLVTPNQNNPKGFWERRDVRRLNDLLLHDMGCDWQRVLALGARQPTAAALAEFHAGASTVVGDLGRHRLSAMKEPRLCITLPWWRPHLEAPVCIFTHRNPVEIARSLAARNGFPEPFGVALWERYMQMALSATSGLPRLVIGHDELLRRPVETTAHLIETLKGLGVTGMEMPDSEAVTGFIDPALHRHTADDAELDGALTREQRALHVSLKDGSAFDSGLTHEPNPVSQDVLGVFEAGLERCIAMRRKHRRRKAEWASERARLEEQTQQARRDTEQLRTALAEAERAMGLRATSPTPTEPGKARDT